MMMRPVNSFGLALGGRKKKKSKWPSAQVLWSYRFGHDLSQEVRLGASLGSIQFWGSFVLGIGPTWRCNDKVSFQDWTFFFAAVLNVVQ